MRMRGKANINADGDDNDDEFSDSSSSVDNDGRRYFVIPPPAELNDEFAKVAAGNGESSDELIRDGADDMPDYLPSRTFAEEYLPGLLY
eukprot:jgi/Bigna1/125680/aug1.1_g388